MSRNSKKDSATDTNRLKEMQLLNFLGKFIDISTPGKFKGLLDDTLEGIDRKDFIKAFKAGDTYFEKSPGEEYAIPHKITDSKKGAIGWLKWFELYIFYAELENSRMPEATKDELRAYLTSKIEEKAKEISRNRTKKQYNSLEGSKVPMFGSDLSRDIASITKKDYTETDEEGNLKGHYKDMDFLAEQKNGATVPFDATAAMTFWIATSMYADQHKNIFEDLNDPRNRTVDITVEEYKNLRGLSDTSSALDNLDKSAIAFTSFRKAAREIIPGKESESIRYKGLSIADNAELEDGVLHIEFTKNLVELITRGAILDMPKAIFKINMQKDVNAFYIAKKLCFHYGYNLQKKEPKANPRRISVKKLLEECRTIPKYEDIKETGRLHSRIIKPFMNALKTLEVSKDNPDGFVDYSFVRKTKGKLTKKEIETIEKGKMPYSDFINLYIDFKLMVNENNKFIEM